MQVRFQNKELKVPDFLIVGAAKSGTTSIYYYLSENPNVFFPKVKEPHFFSFYNNPPSYNSPEKLPTTIASLEKYQSLFKNSEDKIIGEASQSYLYCYEDVIKNIKEIYGPAYKKIKILIVLRNPVDRAWSQYWHFRKNFNEPLSFEETISDEVLLQRKKDNWNVFYDYLGFGNYTKQVKAYQDTFNEVMVLPYDDLKNTPEIFMKKVTDFLDIIALGEISKKKFNISGAPKKNFYGFLWKVNSKNKLLKPLKIMLPYRFRKKLSNAVLEKSLERQVMPDEVRNKLSKIYEKEIESLYKLLDNETVLNWNKKN